MQENKKEDMPQKFDQEVSLKDLIIGIRSSIRFFLSKWNFILIVGMIGAALGLIYAFVKKPVYTATTNFVLETGSNKVGLGAYAGLASSFGIDLGVSGGGLFEGENILELYRSRNMITRTLLSEADFDGKKQLLIDRYIEFNKFREKWDNEPELKDIHFASSNIYTNPRQRLLHDSIISAMAKSIEKNDLNVSKIDKKLNIIKIIVTNKDELFAKIFNESLVKNVNQFYLDTKTKKNLENVNILQIKTDSVRSLLSGSINKAALVADATPNQNPTKMFQRIAPMENATVNAEVNKEVLGTLLQNLELSKISMLRETPLIQIVDEPILPLEKEKIGKFKGLILGGMIGGVVAVFFLSIARFIRKVLTED